MALIVLDKAKMKSLAKTIVKRNEENLGKHIWVGTSVFQLKLNSFSLMNVEDVNHEIFRSFVASTSKYYLKKFVFFIRKN